MTTSRLSGIHPLVIDDDERPSIEDRHYGETFFSRQVRLSLPRWLRRH
jgi:hypothetical protein